MNLRPYQSQLRDDILAAWAAGQRNVLAVLPTGGGKTVLFCSIIKVEQGLTVVFAHRSELVSQVSLTLARNGVVHNVFAPAAVRREIEALHLRETGRRWMYAAAPVVVASIGTLASRKPEWLARVTLWVGDEFHHHCSPSWLKVLVMMPNARGLGVTATPIRSDGLGLGRHADGVIDVMVQGPSMRDLINQVHLCDYRAYAPPNALDLSDVRVGASGEFVQTQVEGAMRRARITGDVVGHYLRVASGKLGVTFVTSLEAGAEQVEAYRAAGVPAELLTGKTPTLQRSEVLRRFAARQVLQVVNCDLLGEGFDCPGIEVVSMARPTASVGLYMQQFGRALRPAPGKPHAIVLDHVGNIRRHGLPDAPRAWTLDRRERAERNAPTDVIPVTTCRQCLAAYERIYPACPYCGDVAVPAGRARPEQVDGDLVLLDPAAARALWAEVARVDAPAEAAPADVVGRSIRKLHLARQEAQGQLRDAIALWAGHQRALGRSDRESHRRFFHRYGVDVLTAQTLGVRPADELRVRVAADLTTVGVVSNTGASPQLEYGT